MRYLTRKIILFLLVSLFLTACTQAAPPTPIPPPPPTATLASRVHAPVEVTPATTEEITAVSQPIWTTPLTGAVNVTPVIDGDLLIAATADGQIHAVEAATGAPVWNFNPDDKLWDASLRVADGYVCVGLEGGKVTCLDADTGEQLWTTELGLEAQSRSALVDGKLYVPTTHVGTGTDNNYEGQATFFALDAATGDLLWEAETDNYILRRPFFINDLIITGGTYLPEDSNDTPTRIYAFDSDSGDERWVYDSNDGIIHWLTGADEAIVFAGRSEIVQAIDPENGEAMWDFGPSYWMQFPAVDAGIFYMGTGDERVHALNGATGEVLWTHSIDLDSLSQIGRPLLRDGTVWVNAVTGDIYGLRQTDGEQLLHLDTGITSRVGGALYGDFYIMGDPEGDLYAYAIR